MANHHPKAKGPNKAPDFCAYCDRFFAEERDHVSGTMLTRKTGKQFSYGEIVPACRECNGLLGDVALHTVSSRKTYLIGMYWKRYRKLLASPEWEECELEELGDSLRKTITDQLRKKEEIKRVLRKLRG